MTEKKANLSKEEIEKTILELKPRFATAGSSLDIFEINPPKVILKFVVPNSFPTFKIQGKLFGAKEFEIESKEKIKKHLEKIGIIVSFND